MPTSLDDNSTLVIDLNQGPRHRCLSAYLAYYGIEKGKLARKMRVSASAMTRFLFQPQAPAARIDQLVDMGIPRQLLPRPSSRRKISATTPQ